MELDGLLARSQQPNTRPCPKPDEPTPHPFFLVLYDPL
jgi:hypothetical protein